MIQITAIVNQNPWWQDAKLIKEDEKVKKALNFNPSKLYVFENKNLLIIGPRQVGKTTFMKLCVLDLINKNIPPKNILYFSCDSLSKKEDLFELFEYFDGIADKGMAKYIFLDEITAIQDWNTSLLALFNSGYFTGNFVYVTSSSYLALKKELLPGRNIDKIIFYPLNFREYFELFYKKVSNKTINITNIKELFEEALRISTSINEFNKAFEEYINYGGGFLSAEYYFKTQNSDPINIFYEPYKDAFVSELVKAERSERIFKQIIFAVIKKYGSRYSLNSITKEVDIASNITVENNIELFEKLFIIRVIYARKDNKISYKSNREWDISQLLPPIRRRLCHKPLHITAVSILSARLCHILHPFDFLSAAKPLSEFSLL